MNLTCDIDRESLRCVRCGVPSSRADIYRMCSVPRLGSGESAMQLAASLPQPSITASGEVVLPPHSSGGSLGNELTHGPGTELKKLLKTWLRIESTPTCSCNARAKRMDEEEAREPGWCEFHLEEIVGWLREEAEKRSLPFLDLPARLLVRRAISNARREQARATQAATAEGSDEA